MNKRYLKEVKRVSRVYHVSDIHVRNFKRHDEYSRVFKTLVNEIRKTHDSESLIVLTGDIVHSKTDVTPELVYQVQKLFKSLAEVGPVIVIPGNHDANLNNDHRMDALTPIVEALNNDRIAYVKNSEVFDIGNVTFCHWSVFDEDYKPASEVEGETKVCLYHGSVQSASTDIGFKLEGGRITPTHFNGYDIVMLGDIHKFQYLNEKKTIAYPGSIIQNNHSESLIHGMLVWNVKERTSEFVRIHNDTGFYTLYVKDGKYEAIPNEVPKNLYLRVRYENTLLPTVKEIIAELRKERTLLEVSIQKVNSNENTSNYREVGTELFDYRDEQQQSKVILEFLEKKHNLNAKQKEDIKSIGKYVNSQITKTEASRNIVWNPKRFEFENMFSYGKENVIDFSNMRGTYGIFAANASGKSTLLDAISYCIFDKCSKTSRSSQVLNSSSNTFYCKLEFELNDKLYVIERDGLREKNGNVRVKVNFYCIDEKGEKVSLNGKERADTNSVIKSVLGSYEDFALTALSAQGANSGFIDMTQKDRKELLSQFLDINAFETLYEVANNEMRDVQAVMKQLQKVDHYQALNEIDEKKKLVEQKIHESKEAKTELESQISSLNKRILEEHILIAPVSSNVVNEQYTKTKIEQLQRDLDACGKTVEKAKEQENKLKIEIQDTENRVIEMDRGDSIAYLEETKRLEKAYTDTKKEQDRLNNQLKALEIHINHHKSKLEKLDQLEYDQNCTYCMNNVFVKDAIQTKKSYEDDENKKKLLVDRIKEVSLEVNSLEQEVKNRESYKILTNTLQQEQNKLYRTQSEIHKYEAECSKIQKQLEDTSKELEAYYKEKKKIEYNDVVRKRIVEYENQHKEAEKKLKKVSEDLTTALLSINSLSSKRDEHANAIIEVSKQQEKFELYRLYTEAVHRDGVPHEIISKTIPQIQDEINTILDQLVDFKIILLPDDKNINAYIAYDTDRYWPIELTSGMEKFVASLAIRSSLINVSSLPRPNFIAIDEGFGALDGGNLGSIVSYFDHLKNQFKFIMIISHIESMRDAVDSHLEICKVDGRSKVYHDS